jgi:hypothetical protein
MARKTSIEGGLERLLRREPGAFVIFEEARAGKFVQFAGSRSEPLLLDLPLQALSPNELPRAFRLLAAYGALPPGEGEGFNLELGSDVARAAEIARRIFQEVYLLSADFDLKVTED